MLHAAMFCKTKTKPKVSEKKGATGQSFIRKWITCYRIGTLANFAHAEVLTHKSLTECQVRAIESTRKRPFFEKLFSASLLKDFTVLISILHNIFFPSYVMQIDIIKSAQKITWADIHSEMNLYSKRIIVVIFCQILTRILL